MDEVHVGACEPFSWEMLRPRWLCRTKKPCRSPEGTCKRALQAIHGGSYGAQETPDLGPQGLQWGSLVWLSEQQLIP